AALARRRPRPARVRRGRPAARPRRRRGPSRAATADAVGTVAAPADAPPGPVLPASGAARHRPVPARRPPGPRPPRPPLPRAALARGGRPPRGGVRGGGGAPERRAGGLPPLGRWGVARGRPPAAGPPRRVPRAPAAALGRLPDHGGGGRKAHGRHDPPPPHAAP